MDAARLKAAFDALDRVGDLFGGFAKRSVSAGAAAGAAAEAERVAARAARAAQ